MSLQSEQLANRLRKLKEACPPPRQEFVTEVERNLVRKAEKQELRSKQYRVLAKSAGIAATVALAIWLPFSNGDQLLHRALSVLPHKAEEQPAIQETERMETIQALELEREPVESRAEPYINVLPRTTAPAKGEEGISTSTLQPPKGKLADTSSPQEKSAIESAAEKYLREQLGNRSKGYQINRSLSNQQQGKIAFSPVINGIPFSESSLTVKMDNGKPIELIIQDTADIPSNLSVFPKPDGLLSPQAAAEKVAATLRLVYLEGEGAGGSLRYQPQFAGYVDAKSGALINPEISQPNVTKQLFTVQAEGRKLVATSSLEAALLLQRETGVAIKNEQLVLTREEADGSTEYIWKLADERLVRAKFAGKSGRLIGYQLEQPSASTAVQPVLAKEQAINLAINHLQRYLPATIREVSVEAVKMESSIMRLQFSKAIQGIPVIDHLYEVSIDMASGKVIGMSGDFAKAEAALPVGKIIISEDAARSQFIANHPLELVYIWPSENGKKADAPRLAYRLAKQHGVAAGVDATTSQMAK